MAVKMMVIRAFFFFVRGTLKPSSTAVLVKSVSELIAKLFLSYFGAQVYMKLLKTGSER